MTGQTKNRKFYPAKPWPGFRLIMRKIQRGNEEDMNREKVKHAFTAAQEIVKSHLKDFKGGFPAPASENQFYPKIENIDWTAGFYTGMLWMFYEESKDTIFRETAQEHLKSFDNRINKRIWVDHHDMGFIYRPSCVAAYKLTGNTKAKETALKAASNLRSRFQEKGQFIQAWGMIGDTNEYRLIIDCLLNLPLLYWAFEETKDISYQEVALAHLKTALSVLIRDDFSTYHTYYFNQKDGSPAYGATKQGYSDESAWSRGQAWGIYGIALNYPHYRKDSLKTTWKGVTDYFLAHLPKDLAAYWDLYFMEGDEPRDSSASAIAVCGILEACRQKLCPESYRQKAYAILESLIDHYAAKTEDVGNGVLKHSTYGRLLGEGIDEYCL